MKYGITEFLGDGIGPELSRAVHILIQGLPIEIEFKPVDLSLENRNRHGRELYDEAFAAISATRYAIKYPTVTERESPNAVIRKLCEFSVIHRPVVSIPGIKTHFTEHLDIDVVRVATGGTYDDPGRMIGSEAAVSIRVVERKPCEEAARFAFQLARKIHKNVTSSSKYTIQSVTDGLFENVVDQIARDYPDIPHRKELFDALLAKLVLKPQDYGVIIVLNEYGDFLSDMACGLIGSMGIGGSGNYAFDSEGNVKLGMFDPVGGTAPDIAGKNVVNPTGMFIALTLMLVQLGEIRLGVTLRETILSLLSQGRSTPDLGGTLKTTEFTEVVLNESRIRLQQ